MSSYASSREISPQPEQPFPLPPHGFLHQTSTNKTVSNSICLEHARLNAYHLPVGIWLQPLDTRFEPIEPFPHSHNTVRTSQYNCLVFSSVTSIDVSIHSAGYGTSNRLPKWSIQIQYYSFFGDVKWIPKKSTSSSISSLFISSVAVFRFSNSIYHFVVATLAAAAEREEEKKNKLVKQHNKKRQKRKNNINSQIK